MNDQSQNPFSNHLILYADDGYESHVARLILCEKQVHFQLADLSDERPEFLTDLNPYHTLPVLTHRDLILYEINVIFEYLEERYQGHKLLPDTPQERAKMRLLAWRIQHDWLSLAKQLLHHPDSFNPISAKHARASLSDMLITLAPLFTHKPFFMADEFGWCDVLLAPLLWRLEAMGIVLPSNLAKPLIQYCQRIFARESFQSSLA